VKKRENAVAFHPGGDEKKKKLSMFLPPLQEREYVWKRRKVSSIAMHPEKRKRRNNN